MPLVKINEKTIVQKTKSFILGKKKPVLIIRLSVWSGYLSWLYVNIWQVLIALSILFIDRYENPELIEQIYADIGGQYNFNIRYSAYGWSIKNVLVYHSLIFILIQVPALIGLILIYRRKLSGYITYFFANLISILFSIYFLGISYFNTQISILDQIILPIMSVLFIIGYFRLKKKRSTKALDKQS